ncbi:TetR/AcrR family transcriptional regulator [Streptacidiphilus sp. MAP5-3]|uniref:TetR/AcrR family transcriptional regulator n=1 Tax=unclassified Streptacidiphilus TaxID=2643834 RepID=UPI003516021A
MPRDTLTRDQIVLAAVELLDAEGLEGLNMRALGARLGSAATAVYWHVGSKENLIALAGDHVWHEIALPDVEAVGWRGAAEEMATGLHTMLARHGWMVQAFGAQPMFGPGKARHDDHNLGIYEAAGFTGAEVDQAAASVFTYVLGNALGLAATASLARRLAQAGDGEARMAEAMKDAEEVAARFPRLRARLGTSSADYGSGPDDAFAFGLSALLDGLEGRISADGA